MYAQILSTVGLGLDAIGAILIAYEVINEFSGYKYGNLTPHTQEELNEHYKRIDLEPLVDDSDAYKVWQSRKKTVGLIGLGLLVLGFVLQAISNWV